MPGFPKRKWEAKLDPRESMEVARQIAGLPSLTFLVGVVVGYGIRSMISRRRHRRAQAKRRLKQSRLGKDEIWTPPPYLKAQASPAETANASHLEQGHDLVPKEHPP